MQIMVALSHFSERHRQSSEEDSHGIPSQSQTNGSLGRKSHFHIFSYLSAAPCLAARFPAKKDITTTQPNPHHHK